MVRWAAPRLTLSMFRVGHVTAIFCAPSFENKSEHARNEKMRNAEENKNVR